MKFKQYLQLIADFHGFIPTPRFRWIIRQNPRKTAREEAIAAEVIRQANPRANITGSFPWGPEQQMVLQQLWIYEPDGKTAVVRGGVLRNKPEAEWQDVPIENAEAFYTVEQTERGDLPVPNAIKEPGTIRGDFTQRLRELLQDDEDS